VPFAAIGCDNDPGGTTRAETAGVYQLRTVNGSSLPLTWPDDHRKLVAVELHLTNFASAAYLLRNTTELDGSRETQILQKIGWGFTTGDSLIVNALLTLTLEPFPGRVSHDTVFLHADPDG
jgi:hypothetical protein